MTQEKEYIVIYTSKVMDEKMEFSFLDKDLAEQEVAELISKGCLDARVETKTLD